jgi:mannose-1-phosphate guanylyltransferase
MHAGAVHAVILAGGSGTRFWPASRQSLPKQFLRLAGGRSMLRATFERLAGLVPHDRVLVVTSEEHAARVRSELPEIGSSNVLAEPAPRNTLAAVALAAFEIERRDRDGVQIVLPADHVIEPVERLRASLAAAVELARAQDVLVLFGIRPTHAATGYGYVEVGEPVAVQPGSGARTVLRFVEKPDEERARSFLASKRFLWNSGIFVWRTQAIRRALFAHAPAVAAALERAHPEALASVYPALPALPVDVGVMEKAQNVCVLPVDYLWSDVGSWSALAEALLAGADGNVHSGAGEVLALDSDGCVVHSEPGALVALLGVHDLVVVQAGGATLVCPRDRAQDVKLVVDALRTRGQGWL